MENYISDGIARAQDMNAKSSLIADAIVKAIADVSGDNISAQDAAVLGAIAAAKVVVAIADRADGGEVKDWIKAVGLHAFTSCVSGQTGSPLMHPGGPPEGTLLN